MRALAALILILFATAASAVPISYLSDVGCSPAGYKIFLVSYRNAVASHPHRYAMRVASFSPDTYGIGYLWYRNTTVDEECPVYWALTGVWYQVEECKNQGAPASESTPKCRGGVPVNPPQVSCSGGGNRLWQIAGKSDARKAGELVANYAVAISTGPADYDGDAYLEFLAETIQIELTPALRREARDLAKDVAEGGVPLESVRAYLNDRDQDVPPWVAFRT